FFSSRRRHTRFSRDWSSDVCSSDLHATECLQHDIVSGLFAPGAVASVPRYFTINQAGVDLAQALVVDTESLRRTGAETLYDHIEIGRASCRERENISIHSTPVNRIC